KDETVVYVQDLATALLVAVLANNVADPDLRAAAVGGHGVLLGREFVGDLRGYKLPALAVLVKNGEGLAVNLHNAAHRRVVQLDEVMERVLTQGALAARVIRLAEVFTKDRNLGA